MKRISAELEDEYRRLARKFEEAHLHFHEVHEGKITEEEF